MDPNKVIERCRSLATITEEAGSTTRTFLCEPMRAVHARVRSWMEEAGMQVRVDPIGNLRGHYPATRSAAPRLILGSHLDTVPRAGAFDGVLGVILAIALVESLTLRRFPFQIEVIGFSEEEGIRYGVPFLASHAVAGTITEEMLSLRDENGVPVRDAIRSFGLDPARIGEARAAEDALGYLEFHIEQGPVLESLDLPLGLVETIAGQTRFTLEFEGKANHAGTTPMHLRRDALAGAAEWIRMVEEHAQNTAGLVATVGRIEVRPGASNSIAGFAAMTLDVRHADDWVRTHAAVHLVECAGDVAARRGLTVVAEQRLDQAAVSMDVPLVQSLENAVAAAGFPVHRMASGAGHDAMILARRMPAAMLFLRSPGGISHHPDESVLPGDVAAALAAGLRFLADLEVRYG